MHIHFSVGILVQTTILCHYLNDILVWDLLRRFLDVSRIDLKNIFLLDFDLLVFCYQCFRISVPFVRFVTRHFRAAVRIRSKMRIKTKLRVRASARMMPLRASIAYKYVLRGNVGQPFVFAISNSETSILWSSYDASNLIIKSMHIIQNNYIVRQ